MQIAAVPAPTNATATAPGVQVMTIAGVDRATNETAPMTVYTRATVGRFDGYGSLASALTAARNLSRGDARSAVVVERTATGAYQVREAVWRILWGRNEPPANRAPFRHFHFEDGSFSQYTAWMGGRRVEVAAQDYFRSWDDVTRWLVDGRRVIEVTSQGGAGR